MAKFVAPEREAGFFVGKEEKEELVAQATQLEVKAVEVRANPFDGDQRQFVITVELDGEERGISYSEGVGSRDTLLYALRDYFKEEAEQEPVFITLDRVKSSAGRPVNVINVVSDDSE